MAPRTRSTSSRSEGRVVPSARASLRSSGSEEVPQQEESFDNNFTTAENVIANFRDRVATADIPQPQQQALMARINDEGGWAHRFTDIRGAYDVGMPSDEDEPEEGYDPEEALEDKTLYDLAILQVEVQEAHIALLRQILPPAAPTRETSIQISHINREIEALNINIARSQEIIHRLAPHFAEQDGESVGESSSSNSSYSGSESELETGQTTDTDHMEELSTSSSSSSPTSEDEEREESDRGSPPPAAKRARRGSTSSEDAPDKNPSRPSAIGGRDNPRSVR